MPRNILSDTQVEKPALQAIESFHAATVKEVENAVRSHDWVIVGMAQNPVVKKAKRFLDEQQIRYHYLEYGSYFSKWHQRLAIKLWSGWPTYPQVFYRGKLVGGASDLIAQFKSLTSSS